MTRAQFRIAVVLAAVGLLAAPALSAEVKVGFPAPVTGPGAEIGVYAVGGAKLAVEEVNRTGAAGAYKIKLLIEDGACSPAGASAATERLISEQKVVALIGAVCSSATMAASEVAQREKIPMVVGISSADQITERGYQYIFRTTPSNSAIVDVFANYLLKHAKPQKMAFIFEQTDWGQEGANLLRKKVEAAGVQVVGFEGVPRTVQNFVPMLTKLKEAKPDATLILLLEPQALQVVRQSNEAGLKTRWLGFQTVSGAGFIDKVPTEVDGLLAHSVFEPKSSDPVIVNFIEQYKKENGHAPDPYAAMAYDSVVVLAAAIKSAGNKSEVIKDALKGLKNVPGVTGSTTFDKNGQASKTGYVIEWHDKKREIVWP
jgi:branched-chain amino acid transport system substrate-binding protein